MHRKTVLVGAVAAIAIALGTWAMDLAGVVEPCGYCRVQRTVIGLLGALLLTPEAWRTWTRYLGAVLAAFGASVAAEQHFKDWNAISQGKFIFVWPLYANSFLLSGFALAIIVGLAFLLFPTRADHR